MTKTSTQATYKGKTYLLKFRGKTKFGPDKAKLAFLDGSKEFWVDGSLISETYAPAASSGSRRSGGNACAECGKSGYLVRDMEDGMLKHRHCCDMEPD